VICSIVGLGVGLISMHIMNGLAFVSGRFTSLMLGGLQGTTDSSLTKGDEIRE
jgi:hypothetical protein